jgi:hypothetical protein
VIYINHFFLMNINLLQFIKITNYDKKKKKNRII